MKVMVLSDLHNEFSPYMAINPGDVEAVILAGDIWSMSMGEAAIRRQIAHLATEFKYIIHVCGNHEYYGSSLEETEEFFHSLPMQWGDSLFLHLGPERVAISIGDCLFVGQSLWTDFGLDQKAMTAAQYSISDYRNIYVRDYKRRLQPLDTVAMHFEQKSRMAYAVPPQGFAMMEEPESPYRSIMLVTHHAPSMSSCAPEWIGHQLTPAFCNEGMEEFSKAREGRIKFWIHGHVHNSVDYEWNGTRVLANPRGYMTNGKIENPNFNPELVLEL